MANGAYKRNAVDMADWQNEVRQQWFAQKERLEIVDKRAKEIEGLARENTQRIAKIEGKLDNCLSLAVKTMHSDLAGVKTDLRRVVWWVVGSVTFISGAAVAAQRLLTL